MAIDADADRALRPALWTLVALFALLAGYSALQLVRMQRAQPRALTPQKLVHLLALLCALRE
jgi:hypothetical protein